MRIQQQSAGSSEGVGITPEVADEPKGSSVAKVDAKDDWDSDSKSDKSNEHVVNEGEVEGPLIDDEEKAYDDEILSMSSNYAPLLDVLVLVFPPRTTLIPTLTTPLPTTPITSEALTVTIIVPDLLLAVIQRLSNLERKFDTWTKVDHFKAIDASVEANLINEVKNKLPKFLPKAVSDLINLRINVV
ncbi:hypothetical protein Tco_1342040 [Tanacetum coccineum]